MALRPIPEDRDAWLALRATNVGASEVAALFDAQPAYAPGRFALWQVKAGRMEPEPVGNERVRWGLLLEDAIAAAAAEREGWRVLPGVFATADRCRGLSATLDRIIAEPGEAERAEGLTGPGALELKNVDWLTHRAKWGEEPPLHILLQLQAQLACTGFEWGALAALVGGNDLRIYRYRRREKVIAEIERRVAAFWQSVRVGAAPNADASDSATRALAAIEPEVVDEPADLTADPEAAILAADFAAAAKEEKAAEKRRKEAGNRLLQKLGGHRWAKVPGWRVSQAVTDENPGTPITAEMVGQIIGKRAGYRSLIVKEWTGHE